MPHGENLILELDNGVPAGVFLKDIGEEVCLLNAEYDVPKEIHRIKISVSDEIAVLSIFTDVFDNFFRFLSAIFAEHHLLTQEEFWHQVADVILNYQQQHSDLTHRFKQWDLFCNKFLHSCLNRLQLKNNFQMVDLTDPAGSLQFSGFLNNPIAPFAINNEGNRNE
jgi:siderophore synthetase component